MDGHTNQNNSTAVIDMPAAILFVSQEPTEAKTLRAKLAVMCCRSGCSYKILSEPALLKHA